MTKFCSILTFRFFKSKCLYCSANTSPSLNPVYKTNISPYPYLYLHSPFFNFSAATLMNFFISSPLNTCNCFVLNWFFEGSITPTIGLKTIFRSMTYCRKNPFRASYAFLILLCDRPCFCIRLMIES